MTETTIAAVILGLGALLCFRIAWEAWMYPAPMREPARYANVYLMPDGTQWQGSFATMSDCLRWQRDYRETRGDIVLYRIAARFRSA